MRVRGCSHRRSSVYRHGNVELVFRRLMALAAGCCSLLATGQVGSYPVLKVSRTRDWGWCLTNKFVTIVSANKP